MPADTPENQIEETAPTRGRGIQFKLSLVAVFLLLTVLLMGAWLVERAVRGEFEASQREAIDDRGTLLVAELRRRTTLVNGLAQGLARFAENAPSDPAFLNKSIPSMLDLPRASAWVAGGGYWPEPFAFDPKRERSSFFWARESDGELRRYENYNLTNGPGYHRREWYVPARYLKAGECYWSRTYVDPYTRQPMVTCTVPVSPNNEFSGAVTVDLSLEGLSEVFEQQTQSLRGYAFALDQHNNFITLPSKLPINAVDRESSISIDALANSNERYRSLAKSLRKINAHATAAFKNSAAYPRRVVADIAHASDEISLAEAEMIALTLQDVSMLERPEHLEIEHDPVLGETGLATVFLVPDSYWRVVVVTPKSVALSQSRQLLRNMIFQLAVPVTLAMLLAFLLLRRLVIKPVQLITAALQRPARDGRLNLLTADLKDEFAQLSFWFNRSSQELHRANERLEVMNKELEFQANFDFVTRLYNRRHFEQALDVLAGNEGWPRHAVMLIGVDQFRVINDTSGHAAGDAILVQMANLLRSLDQGNDILSRLSGNEFAKSYVSPNIQHAQAVAENVRKAVEVHPFVWEGHVIPVTASIGVVHLADVQRDRTLVMRLVDGYGHIAKESGRNCVRGFEADGEAINKIHDEMGVFYKLQEALALDLFFMEFQLIEPITGRSGITKPAMEALVRLREPDGSVLYPGAFLPAAERYNAIEQIDRWVIENTIMTLAGNRAILEEIEFCSINLSGASLVQHSLVLFIKELLQRFRIPARKLCFEVTETQVISNLDRARTILSELGDRGCRLALDDFGSGMSSFGYLRDLPVDIVKIDGRFVRDICTDAVDHAFVKSIGDVARAMNLFTIAEFVENDTSLAALQVIGIDFAQGYYLGKPVALDELLKTRSSRIDVVPSDGPDAYLGG